MFTGIVEKSAKILSVAAHEQGLKIEVDTGWFDIQLGESICVNGVCLTAIGRTSTVQFDVSPETLLNTNFQALSPGDMVNLERAMTANGRFGGHIVTGHVDTRARLAHKMEVGEFTALTFDAFEDSKAPLYLIKKGSIAINGVSLTINQASSGKIEVMIIPHTLQQTSLSLLSVGDSVNIEFDYFARLISHQLSMFQQEVIS